MIKKSKKEHWKRNQDSDVGAHWLQFWVGFISHLTVSMPYTDIYI